MSETSYPRTLYLHIGRGQTGTTAIQRSLHDHRAVLREHGIHYLVAGHNANGGHQDFAKAFIDEPPHYMERVRHPGRILSAVHAEIAESSAASILISSEILPSANLTRLAAFLGQLPGNFDVRVILFVRTQDELAESEYNQVVKSAGETRTFSDYVAEGLTDFDFLEICENWTRVFGPDSMTMRVYDGSKQDSLQKLLSCLGSTSHLVDLLTTQTPAVVANRSLGFQSLRLARTLNNLRMPMRRRLYRRLFSRGMLTEPPAVLMNSSEARELRRRFAESNRAVSSRFLGAPSEGLGGRRYSDDQRDRIRREIERRYPSA